MPTHWVRNGFIGVLVVLLLVAFIGSIFRSASRSNQIPFSEVVNAGRQARLEKVEVSGTWLNVKLRSDGTTYHSRVGSRTDLEQVLGNNGVTIGGNGDRSVEITYKGAGVLGAVFGIAVGLGVLIFVFYAGRWSKRGEGTKPS
jgi:hypothetical protein